MFVYGTCTTPEGKESCPVPIAIRIDPCALTVDGQTIPKGSQPVRSMTVRGTKADISRDGVLHFEQSPQIITIYAPEGGTADERQAKVVELRMFGGMTVEETAEFLSNSPATVHRDWATGKIWLTSELGRA